MASKFIPFRKIKELREAVANGNEKAKVIMDKYMEANPDMESIDRLLEDYYGEAPIETLTKVLPEVPEPTPHEEIVAEAESHISDGNREEIDPISEEGMPESIAMEIPDLTADLDRELDGIIDVEEFDDESFSDFLGTKRSNLNRARKDASYFKAFDQGGRAKYLQDKIDGFTHGFDGRLRDLQRKHNDIDTAIGGYDLMVTDMPDDGVETNMDFASKAYDEFTTNEGAMGAFGRSWDEEDTEQIRSVLSELVSKYGRANVKAVLNTLREDANAWHNEAKGKIDSSISKYGKSLESLLK